MSDDVDVKNTVEANSVSSMARAGRCLYCNKEVTEGGLFHEGCDEDYVWQQKMKAIDAPIA